MLGKGEASDRGDGDDGVWIFFGGSDTRGMLVEGSFERFSTPARLRVVGFVGLLLAS